ncbi:MAG: acetyl-CoA carboxylase biotin carboxylase subunit [Rhodospirillaceae bacterium]|nr:acetyl-CoA carboxylase biotin carboxylase subunit [Rhodospirillaceae bacterium]
MVKKTKPFKKILIANRGEIACRVIRSAREMGIKTVAIYSEADIDALHVSHADEAVCVGPPPSSESYLNIKSIMNAIKQTGAEAVHPGYGFLSENAAFGRALKKAGITFIGPNELAIKAMGDKIESKKLAEKNGVNVIPGHTAALKNEKEALSVAKKIGYPVMLKASAGGGGKGMRVCKNETDVIEAFVSAVREAKSSFGDDRVFMEKYIENPRHIEIQVLADSFGNTVYLFERECSIQRRHQKVIEEAPSPFLDEKTRAAMGAQAVKLAKAVKYVSAGTVEFIVDSKKNFYFLEMNTRLQVEHPVTEKITGLDLVELMIRIAAGEKLPFKQADLKINGWAIESRIYAEDPFRGFLPSIGRLSKYSEPQGSKNVRVDSGVYEGGEISMHYDPMIAKLVSYGKNRSEAIKHMRHALDEFYIRGVRNNISFLSALVCHPRFAKGDLSTNFIADEYPSGFSSANVPHDNPAHLVAVAASVHMAYQMRAALISGRVPGRDRAVCNEWVVHINGIKVSVLVEPFTGGWNVEIISKAKGIAPQKLKVISDWQTGDAVFTADISGTPAILQINRLQVGYQISHSGTILDVHVLSKLASGFFDMMPEKRVSDTSRLLMSPMPGLLLSLAVSKGQEVKAGEELAVIEAMKMENVLRAQQDGIVKEIKATPGDSLAVDQIIVEFE